MRAPNEQRCERRRRRRRSVVPETRGGASWKSHRRLLLNRRRFRSRSSLLARLCAESDTGGPRSRSLWFRVRRHVRQRVNEHDHEHEHAFRVKNM